MNDEAETCRGIVCGKPLMFHHSHGGAGEKPRQESRHLLSQARLELGRVKFILEQATRHAGGVEVKPYSFFNSGARWGGWPTPHPDGFTSGKDSVPIV